MGIIIAKFRKKKSTYDVLEKLENEIISIEEFGRSTEQTRKKIVGRFVLLAILVYLALAFVLYVYYHKITSSQKLIYITPLIAFPLVIWLIKQFLTWYYSRKIRKNEKKLIRLKDEKNKILDNVMETETYKVAKKILDKFGSEQNRKPLLATSESTPIASKPRTTIVPSTLKSTGLRQRNVGPQDVMRGRIPFGGPPTPYSERQLVHLSTPTVPATSVSRLSLSATGTLPGTPLLLPRSILPRDRSVLDKMVDYLVGDGPSNRYALICKRCNSHNGMALKEEFEYLSFRCCYCSAFNPARKKRPSGPKFESNVSPLKAVTAATADSTDSDKDSASSSDVETSKPSISEIHGDLQVKEKTEENVELETKSTSPEKVPPDTPMEIDSEVLLRSTLIEEDVILNELCKDTVTESENITSN